MDRYDEVKEWIRIAEMDLTIAKHCKDTMYPQPLEIICYHCQQSAEKILKAFLVYSNIKPPKIHDLEDLKLMCENIDSAFLELTKECVRLNDYSSQPRYPMEEEITNGDMLLAISDCEKIYEFVKDRITFEDREVKQNG